MWFTENLGNRIGRITLSRDITELNIPTRASGPVVICADNDDALWFVEIMDNKIGQLVY